MPGNGTVTIGRTSLYEAQMVTLGNGSSSLQGQESTPPDTAAIVEARIDNLLALKGRIVPVTFTEKSSLDGFYLVGDVSLEYKNYDDNVLMVDWSVSVKRLLNYGHSQMQSEMTTLVRTNSHSFTGETWHSPAVGATTYEAGSTEPSTVTRTGASGVATIYRNVSQNPTWTISPANYYNGSCEVSRPSDGFVYEGEKVNLDETDWMISNDFIKFYPDATNPGDLAMEYYNGTSWVVGEDLTFRITAIALSSTGWEAATILSNTPQQCVIRLEKALASGVGKFVLDLTVVRGQRVIYGYIQTTSAKTIDVQTSDQGATSPNTYMIEGSGSSRWVLASSAAVTWAPTNGRLSLASVTSLDFVYGYVTPWPDIGGNYEVDLIEQYIGQPAITDRILRR